MKTPLDIKNANTEKAAREAARYPWLVVRTAFHSGGVVSRHQTEEAAKKARRRYATGDCECGCAHVVTATDYRDLPIHTETTPYAAAW